ncbi:MAG TPA: hypothetical protein VI299_18910 [Polyangiales bacterium]
MASSDGLFIKWRETPPDRGMLDFALAELDVLHARWPETVQCNIVIERAPTALAAEARFRAHVQIELNRRGSAVSAKAVSDDAYAALRRAFGDLRNCTPFAHQPASEVAA